ncbi:MAG: cupin domain-containing protein [Brevinema sp.]
MLFQWEQSKAISPAEGLERCTLATGGSLMAVQLKLEKGAKAAEHSHVHEQLSYIIEGRFEFTIDGKVYQCKTGDTLYVASNLPHSVVCIEQGSILDTFTPQREDLK